MNKVLIVGDVHSNYELLRTILCEHKDVDIAIQVGDLGLFCTKHAAHQDKKAYEHNEDRIDTFIAGYEKDLMQKLPVLTYFTKGNHDDYDCLHALRSLNLYYLETSVYNFAPNFSILILGGIFSPVKIEFAKEQLAGRSRRFFTKDDIKNVMKHRDIDVMISHQAAHGILPPNKKGIDEGIKIITEVIDTIKPKYYIHGHHHIKLHNNS